MKYASLQEYFYKLQNVLYLLLLLPLVLCVVLFVYDLDTLNTGFPDQDFDRCSLVSFLFIGGWAVAYFTFSRLKSIRTIPGLGMRLERYYIITIVRFIAGSVTNVIMVAAYFFTTCHLSIVFFGCGLILSFLLWPRPGKVCRDLRLKGDEREMVFHKRMKLY